jgi:hypothetical protein
LIDSFAYKITSMQFCEKHNIESKYKCGKCTIEKRQRTMMIRYGVTSALHSDDIKAKKKSTCIEKFGVEHSFASEEVKKKCKKTLLERYGTEYSLSSQEVREKGKETMLRKYGVEHSVQNEEISKKRDETNIKRFGVKNALQNPDIVKKRKQTNLERYGVEEVLQSPQLQERIKNTMIDTYGASNPLQCEEIKARKDKTCEERYGDKDIMKNPAIFEKISKNSFKRKEYELPSGKKIVYQGYENVALDELLIMLNEEDITNDVKQMPKFMYEYEDKLHRYYPDIYIPSQKRIIEVKSDYTYNKYLEKNQCKKAQVLKDGYKFEFWICNPTKIVEKC